MKNIFLIFTLLFCTSVGFASEKQASQITLGMLPGGDPETVRAQAIELAKELQALLAGTASPEQALAQRVQFGGDTPADLGERAAGGRGDGPPVQAAAPAGGSGQPAACASRPGRSTPSSVRTAPASRR